MWLNSNRISQQASNPSASLREMAEIGTGDVLGARVAQRQEQLLAEPAGVGAGAAEGVRGGGALDRAGEGENEEEGHGERSGSGGGTSSS